MYYKACSYRLSIKHLSLVQDFLTLTRGLLQTQFSSFLPLRINDAISWRVSPTFWIFSTGSPDENGKENNNAETSENIIAVEGFALDTLVLWFGKYTGSDKEKVQNQNWIHNYGIYQ